MDMGDKYMRKAKSILVILLCVMILCACGNKNIGLDNYPEFIGKWQCAEAPLEHPDYYTAYLMLVINEDGSFSMYDAEAGNPGLKGELQVISDKELSLDCNPEDDFDPPPTWQSMNEEQVIEYSFTEDGQLHMKYKEGELTSTLVFVKQ